MPMQRTKTGADTNTQQDEYSRKVADTWQSAEINLDCRETMIGLPLR